MNKWTVAFLAVFIMVAANTFAAGDNTAPSIPAGDTTATCNFATSGTVKFRARWVLSEYECPAGHYLPKNNTSCVGADTICEADHYCTGGTYTYSTTEDQGMQACPTGMKSPAGSKSANDCGYILHVGDSIIYLHKQNANTGKPRLAVKVGAQTYYANMTPTTSGAKQMTSGSDATKLHIKLGDTDYTVYDNSVFYQE